MLNAAKPEDHARIARRLNEAAERAIAVKDSKAIEDEIVRMRGEGLFGT